MVKKLFIFLLALFIGVIFSQVYNSDKNLIKGNDLKISKISSTKINSQQQDLNKQNLVNTSNTINKNRFSNAGISSNQEVIDFYLNFQKAVSNDDKKAVASMMDYPACVRFAVGDLERTGCRKLSRKAFIRNYDKIFDADFKNFIKNIDVNKEGQLGVLWSNWRGITMDRGQIWFGGICRDKDCNKYELKITALSSGLLQRPYNKSSHEDN